MEGKLMIFIGLQYQEKQERIAEYRKENGIEKVIVFTPEKFPFSVGEFETVGYADIIRYVYFYRLLQEITPKTLVVINECMRTQNRYDLTYNCIRNFLNITTHKLIFQQLPIIDAADDFMILFDFDTGSRWKRRPFDSYLIQQEAQVRISELPISFEGALVSTSSKTKERYEREREKMFGNLGSKDPHALPRNLYLIGGADKLSWIDSQSMPLFSPTKTKYVARNARLGRKNIVTYADAQPGERYTIVELPHRFIDFSDFIQVTGQTNSQVLIADLKVDHWYLKRYTEWSQRIHDTYASLS